MIEKGTSIHINKLYKDGRTDYATDDMPVCPKCGAKPFIHRDIVDGFYFGWSVGCPRYCHDDGIHGTTPETPEEDTYSIFNLSSKEECVEKWKERVKHLKEVKMVVLLILKIILALLAFVIMTNTEGDKRIYWLLVMSYWIVNCFS